MLAWFCGKFEYRLVNTSKTMCVCVNAGKSGSKIQSTPTKAGGDRYIPNRSTMQMDMANFLLTKENDPAEDSPTKKVSTLL